MFGDKKLPVVELEYTSKNNIVLSHDSGGSMLNSHRQKDG